MDSINKSQQWLALEKHQKIISKIPMTEMFDEDPKRFERFSIEFGGLLLDYSKNIIDEKTIRMLLGLARKAGLKEKTEQMFTGSKINATEKRAVLHTALRNQGNKPIYVDGNDIMPQINRTKQKMRRFTESLHRGKITGSRGDRFTDIVNIGIGGSHLGPEMVCSALKPYAIQNIRMHFVSNVDGADLTETLKLLTPKTTLFIVASKTFTTQETLTNAMTARKWLLEHIEAGSDGNYACGGSNPIVNNINNPDANTIAKHFVAISANFPACVEFGIAKENIFELWDWVGGRYSLWSAIGLSIALSIGMDNFDKMLHGGAEMDEHFRNKPHERNMPVIMAIIAVWYCNFFGAGSSCVVPYDNCLSRFPDFLQQLEMESSGKSIAIDGRTINYATGPVIYGSAGTNAQHSFFQMLHQGTSMIPVDLLAAINSPNKLVDHHKILLSNFFAQAEALMKGKSEEEVREELASKGHDAEEIADLAPHKVFAGNRPTNSLLYKRLSPAMLGRLIALYEHKVFVQGIIWGINSFDQFGVELGKQLAGNILAELADNSAINAHDSSTNGLINYFKQSEDRIV